MTKRFRILVATPLVLAMALGGLKWKLDHPALTKADAAFARLVAGADAVEISTLSGTVATPLRSTQIADLEKTLRFDDVPGTATQGYDSYYTLCWKKQGRILARFDTDCGAEPPSLWSSGEAPSPFNWKLKPRFSRRFEEALETLLPNRWEKRR